MDLSSTTYTSTSQPAAQAITRVQSTLDVPTADVWLALLQQARKHFATAQLQCCRRTTLVGSLHAVRPPHRAGRLQRDTTHTGTWVIKTSPFFPLHALTVSPTCCTASAMSSLAPPLVPKALAVTLDRRTTALQVVTRRKWVSGMGVARCGRCSVGLPNVKRVGGPLQGRQEVAELTGSPSEQVTVKGSRHVERRDTTSYAFRLCLL